MKRGGVLGGVLAICLMAVLSVLLPPVSAQTFGATASIQPSDIKVGQDVNIRLNISNTGTVVYQDLVVQIFVYPEAQSAGQPRSNQTVKSLGAGKSVELTLTYTPHDQGPHTISVKFFNSTTSSSNYLDQEDLPAAFTAKPVGTTDGGGDQQLMLIVIVTVVAIAAVAGGAVFFLRKKKKELEAAEAASKAAAAAARAQREAAQGRIQGKFPKDYYKFRRERLSKLKPVGLTRSGDTILGNTGHKEVEHAGPAEAAEETCPRCEVKMGHDWKTCKNCSAKSIMERAGEALDKLEAAGGNVTSLREMLQTAETERQAGNYDETETYGHDVLDRTKIQLRRQEEARKLAEEQAAEQHSYAPETLATKEPEPEAARGYTREEEGVKGYAADEQMAKGYMEPAPAREYAAEPAASVAGRAARGEVAGAAKEEKKEGPSCVKCAQQLKPEWKKCPFCGAAQEGLCPNCGRTVKLKWNVCPQCRTDLQEHTPKPACPVCGAEMTGGECQSCKARSLMDIVSRLVREVKAKGADVVEAEALMGRGELAIKIKNFDKAVAHFEKAQELAQRSRKEYRTKKLGAKIEHARTLAKDCADMGADVSEVTSLIGEAASALADERFDDGMALVEKAAKLAEAALDKHIEGREAQRKAKVHVSVKKPMVVGQVTVKPRCPHCQEFVEEGWPVCPFCQSPLSWPS